MFRKFLLASAASLGMLSPLAIPSSAVAHEHRHQHVYRVYFREAWRPGWSFGGRFHSLRAAEHFAERYRCRGIEVRIG
jgi:hypothetical protein